MVNDFFEGLAELLTISDKEFCLFVAGIVEVGKDTSASGLIGVYLPQLIQSSVSFFVIRSKLFQPSLIFSMEASSNDVIVMDGEYVAAPLVVVPLEETEPSAHPVPTLFVFAQNGTARTFTAYLFDATKKGRVFLLEGLPINHDAWEVP
jgi:hypothetical protein